MKKKNKKKRKTEKQNNTGIFHPTVNLGCDILGLKCYITENTKQNYKRISNIWKYKKKKKI